MGSFIGLVVTDLDTTGLAVCSGPCPGSFSWPLQSRESALGIALPVVSQQMKGSESPLAAPPWTPPVTMDGREGGGCGAVSMLSWPGCGRGWPGAAAMGAGQGQLLVPLGLPLPAHAWGTCTCLYQHLPTTISSTESPFKMHHKSPGSKVVTLGTASLRSWKESVSQLG